ncbi:NAD-dependent succinate-semialdehyde dehydrogenase [Microvirga soli]|uniref:NAD-dependent succinate-semialdehyde dehydrogenase n=1 Tax=Microvirga soli TaxID=1854496 RepID=UPI00191EDEBD|nr:NAD-dependent succinate-semialdehyde dehydrogenase [Microvirga soli]
MYSDVLLYIDGVWQPGRGKPIPILNPANEDTIGTVACADQDDLNRALNAAARGFAEWCRISAFERSKLMRRAADLLRGRQEDVARLMTLEQGKPLTESRAETAAAADIIDWFAEEARRTYGRVIPARSVNVQQLVVKEPVGPIAAFTPWNFPINQAVRKISAALAAGCSVILKAPEETPAAPAALVRAYADAGLPAGVLNLVYGNPAEISGHLIPHATIRKISFTGSTAVGKHLASLAGLHMKRVTMELGGHAPALVLPDADIEKTAKVLAMSKFRNAGQICVAPTRFIVHEDVHDEFIGRLAAAAEAINVGDGLADGTTMGPLANARRVHAMEDLIQDAVSKGARVVTGGRRIGNKGYFFEPTVLSAVPREARAMNEEPFGPLALVVPYGSLSEAIAEANRLNYGLAAYGFTRSAEHAATLAASIESGMVSINHYGLALPEVPFGGIKDSGYGSEGGTEAMEAYLNTKFVSCAN